jgi:hypothetical protein
MSKRAFTTTYFKSSFLLLVALLGVSQVTFGQSNLPDWNQQRLQRTRYSMMVLGGWATANLAIGAVGMARTSGSTRAFHQMNLGWGAINLGLAASGYWTAMHADPSALNAWDSQQELIRLRQIFLFNAGLDVGYMAAGAWMLERAKNTANNAERWRGFGRSIILQGAFLFVFDLGAFAYHGPLMDRIRPMMGAAHTQVGWKPDGLSVCFYF